MNTDGMPMNKTLLPGGKWPGFARIRHIHFVGIGGAGMSGIAEVLHNLGYIVSGSDLHETAVCLRLKSLGIRVEKGHDTGHLQSAEVVVVSTAVGADNAEIQAARALRIPVVPRAEMLAELMRFRFGIAIAGTHGKTTTTSLIASVLAEAGLDPTFVIGGQLNSAGVHARLGEGRYLVAEADESDASFLYLQPMIAVVTNIDHDHMQTYGGDFAKLKNTFVEFLHHLPFYGLAVLCYDDPVLHGILSEVGRPQLTYGLKEGADVRAVDIEHRGLHTHFIAISDQRQRKFAVDLNLPGKHNVLNALACLCVGFELDLPDAVMQTALQNFQGIGRRFQVNAELTTAIGTMTLMDDYGHHPREIQAVLDAARCCWPGRRLILAFQPHRYTRTRDLFEDFVEVLSTVDGLVLFEVYAAGEKIISGADGRTLSRSIRARGQVDPVFSEEVGKLAQILAGIVQDNDVVITMGAGDIGAIAAKLPQHLAAALGSKVI